MLESEVKKLKMLHETIPAVISYHPSVSRKSKLYKNAQ